MSVKLLLGIPVLLASLATTAHAATSCDEFFSIYDFSAEAAKTFVNERLSQIDRQSSTVTIGQLESLSFEVSAAIGSAWQTYSAGRRVYREEFSAWDRVDPRNKERRAASSQFSQLSAYIRLLESSQVYIRQEIRRLKNGGTLEDAEKRPFVDVLGDPLTLQFARPFGGPNGSFIGGSDSFSPSW